MSKDIILIKVLCDTKLMFFLISQIIFKNFFSLNIFMNLNLIVLIKNSNRVTTGLTLVARLQPREIVAEPLLRSSIYPVKSGEVGMPTALFHGCFTGPVRATSYQNIEYNPDRVVNPVGVCSGFPDNN
jgi:hypothetical protein